MLQLATRRTSAIPPGLIKRLAEKLIPGPGTLIAGVMVAWEDANKWADTFSDEAVDKMFDNNWDFRHENADQSKADAAKDLCPDSDDDELHEAMMEQITEMLGDYDTEFGQEYEQIFSDAYQIAAGVDKKDLASEDTGLPDTSTYSDAFRWLSDVHGMSGDDAVTDLVEKDMTTDENGVTIDLTQRRSRTSQLLMSLMEYAAKGGAEGVGMELVHGPLEGEMPADADERAETVKVPEDASVIDDLRSIATDVANAMIEKNYKNKFDRYGSFDNDYDSLVWSHFKEFIAKWEPQMPALLKEWEAERAKQVTHEESEAVAAGTPMLPGMEGARRGMTRTAQDPTDEDYTPSLSGHEYLGRSDNEFYFMDMSDLSVQSGDIISSGDLHEKTVSFWESFFDGEPDQIASMMERGFLQDVHRNIIDDLVRDDASEMMGIEERESWYSPTLDEDFPDKEEAKDAIVGMVESQHGDTENPAGKAAFIAAWDELESKTVYHSDVWGKDFDSEADYEKAAREHYEGDFKTYAGDLSRYSRKAAEEVADTDGDGHGLDVTELNDGNYLSSGSFTNATNFMTDKSNPANIRLKVKQILKGGKPEQVSEPLE